MTSGSNGAAPQPSLLPRLPTPSTPLLPPLLLLPLLPLLLLGSSLGSGCSAEPTPNTVDAARADTDSEEPPRCTETASGKVPAEATVMAWEEDGSPASSVVDHSWNAITGASGEYMIGEEPTWEAVRFELPAPTTVYGVRAQWANLRATEEEGFPITIGLYPDFGGNGYDFDHWHSLWEGDRCLTENDNGEWIDYVLETPLEVARPGIIFAAHFFAGASAPAFVFDEYGNDCSTFDGCHSSLTMPNADSSSSYTGISFRFAYDFKVRLLAVIHDTVPKEAKWFKPQEGIQLGGRVAWADYDNDGYADLMTSGPTLFHNNGNGNGTFSDVTSAAGLDAVRGLSGGGVWGDYDNDGCLDYFGQRGADGPDLLLHGKCDGTFENATETSLIADRQDEIDCIADLDAEYAATEGSAWVDLDQDGLLDLYLAEHECWKNDKSNKYRDRIWHNQGDGTFVEWGAEHGFVTAARAGRGVSPADFDLDGDVDVFVSNYRLDANFMYVNDGDGTFSEQAIARNLAGVPSMGAYGHTIGSAWFDLENDGDFDLVQANLAHPRFYQFSDRTMIMVNDGSGKFTDVAAAAGVLYRETHSNPTVQDFDNDGFQDIFVTCVYDSRPSDFYVNRGDGTFDEAGYQAGAVVENGWGSAAADYDNDGDIDLAAYSLYRNESAAAGNHWLQVRALGGTSSRGPVNAAGIGAVIRVVAGGESRLGHTSGGSGTGCQDTPFVSFGLGSLTTVDSIVVLYPGGAETVVPGPIQADQRVWVKADGAVAYGWAPPF
ncbi:MAG: CRTAC1 family protein [Pseudomonadota bacterium]